MGESGAEPRAQAELTQAGPSAGVTPWVSGSIHLCVLGVLCERSQALDGLVAARAWGTLSKNMSAATSALIGF